MYILAICYLLTGARWVFLKWKDKDISFLSSYSLAVSTRDFMRYCSIE